MAITGSFVRTIDIHAKIIDVIEVEHRDSALDEPLSRGVGTGNGGPNAVAVWDERFDEPSDRGPGTDADDGALFHVFQRGQGRQPLVRVTFGRHVLPPETTVPADAGTGSAKRLSEARIIGLPS